MQNYFYDLSERLFADLQNDEVAYLNFDGEESDFVRLNHAKVRQAGTVFQAFADLTLALPKTRQQANRVINLTRDLEQDEFRLKMVLRDLRATVIECPEDPYLILNESVLNSERRDANHLKKSQQVIEEICANAQDLDLVGIYCAGVIYRGYASSYGQRNWYQTHSFNFDWSCYLQADKAVKSNYAGFQWDSETFALKMKGVRQQLELLRLPSKRIEPGHYRVYLSPAAMDEVMNCLKWGGFSEKALRTKQSCFARMRDQGIRLHDGFSLTENIPVGVAPSFDRFGFPRPEVTKIIEHGILKQGMVSPRTGKEYSIPGNGADREETPCTIEVAPGKVSQREVLQALDTGILINNLWYLNYSDRNAGRITGMTRFATFWVENGEIKAPVDVMRFDDSVYDFWGQNLLGLTQEREFCISTNTYTQRDTSSALLPGALVEKFKLTL